MGVKAMIDRRSKRTSVRRAVSRRFLLGTVLPGAVAAPLLSASADAQDSTDVAAPVERLDAALLAIMKSGERVSFQRRFEVLVPIVEQTFDLPAVLQLSVGPRWASLSVDDQRRLISAFRRYTVANYVANFDSFSGQRFVISPNIRSLVNGDRIVQTTISPGE